MNGYYYSFTGSAASGFGGFGNVFQQQIDPTILRIMNIANSDPIVNAFCRANRITDAKQLYQMLIAEGKKRYEESLKVYAKEYLENLVPELERGYDPEHVKHKHDNDVKGFDTYYIQLDAVHSIYQCSCGMLVIDEDPKGFNEDSGGHKGYGTWNKEQASELPPMPHKTVLNIKTELVELTSSDGINYSVPEPN